MDENCTWMTESSCAFYGAYDDRTSCPNLSKARIHNQSDDYVFDDYDYDSFCDGHCDCGCPLNFGSLQSYSVVGVCSRAEKSLKTESVNARDYVHLCSINYELLLAFHMFFVSHTIILFNEEM